MQLIGPRLHSCRGRNDFQSKRAAWQKTKILRRRPVRAARPTSKSPRRGPTRKKMPISRPIKAFASPITRIRCARARAARPCSKILSCGKKYSTLTTSEFRNVSCTRAVLPRTVILRISNRWPISQRPTCSSARAKRRRLFTRISTVAGGAGSVDTPRDVRGFAVKFYTKEGNWDLVGNNIPVFFIQDAIKFPDLIHAVKMEPDRGFPQSASAHDTFWDFISLTPESMHMVM